MNSGKFSKFDYGYGNRRKYGEKTPPEYDLSKIDSKFIALFSGLNDLLATPEDVNVLRNSLKGKLYTLYVMNTYKIFLVPLLEDYVIPFQDWNHLDFVWSKEAGRFINYKILELLSKTDL